MTDKPKSLTDILGVHEISEVTDFFEKNSDSLPVIIDRERVILYCNPKLRELLGYGWQADIVNGTTTIDVLIPSDFQVEHAALIERWFQRPVALDMHVRGALPLITAGGHTLRALVKLVPYELSPQLKAGSSSNYRALGVAFVTLLPVAWGDRASAPRA